MRKIQDSLKNFKVTLDFGTKKTENRRVDFDKKCNFYTKSVQM